MLTRWLCSLGAKAAGYSKADGRAGMRILGRRGDGCLQQLCRDRGTAFVLLNVQIFLAGVLAVS